MFIQITILITVNFGDYMAESQLVRVIGIDSNIPNPMSLQSPTHQPIPDVTGQKFAEARQYQEQAYQAQLNSINAIADAKVKEAQSRTQSKGAETLAGIVGNLTGGLALYQKALKEKQDTVDKAYETQVKTQQAEGKLLAQTLIRDKLLELRSQVVSGASEDGVEKTRGDLELILNKQFKDLTPEVRDELWKIAFSGLDEVSSKQTERQFQQLKETKEAWRDYELAKLNASTASFSVRLSTAKTVEEQTEAWNGFWESFNTGTEKLQLDAKDKAYIATKLLNHAVEQYQGGEKNRQSLVESANVVKAFYDEIQPTVDQYNKGEIGEYEYRSTLRYVATKHGVPELAGNVPDIFSTTDKATAYEKNQEALRKMAQDRAEVVSFDDANKAEAYHVGALTYDILQNSPEARMLLLAAKEGKTPLTTLQRMAVQAAEDFNKDRKEWLALQQQYAQYSVQVAKVIDQVTPGRLGDPQTIDPITGILKQVETQKDPRTGLPILRPETSPEVRDAIIRLSETVLPAMRELRDRWLAVGLNIDNPKDNAFIKQMEAQTSGQRKAAEAYDAKKKGGSVLPNFNRGVAAGYPETPPIAPFAKINGVTIPFHGGVPVTVTSGYGWRTHPIRGGKRFHSGIDYAATGDNVSALTVQGGTVVLADTWGGYGGTVMVRTHDGRVEQYSHLRKLNVKNGQSIPPGYAVGLIGGDPSDPHAGDSTGRHLHFQVWLNDNSFTNPQTGTIDPIRYLSSIRHAKHSPRGLGSPPTNTAPGRMGSGLTSGYPSNPQASGGLLKVNPRLIVRQRVLFNNANPMSNGYASIHKQDYQGRNNPQANYGYGVIAKDRQFARKIASVADSVGIPAQWLVDVMAFETGGTFSPSIRNAEGATGLIQFYPDDVGGITKTMNGRTINLLEIAGWSRTRQMDLVREYLAPYKGRLNTVEDVLAIIFGGEGLLNQSPQSRSSARDSSISFSGYVKRLGEHVGRRYQTSYDRGQVSMRRVHSAPVGGCLLCQNMIRKYGEIITHEAPLR
jgi:murein DD-endopeptidase MepM/ murein hydrolase activator NlpD